MWFVALAVLSVLLDLAASWYGMRFLGARELNPLAHGSLGQLAALNVVLLAAMLWLASTVTPFHAAVGLCVFSACHLGAFAWNVYQIRRRKP
jgi:hypothetical protein